MSMFTGLPGSSAQHSHIMQTLLRNAERRSFSLQRPIKNTYSNGPKRSTLRHSFTLQPHLYCFTRYQIHPNCFQLWQTNTLIRAERLGTKDYLISAGSKTTVYRVSVSTHRYTNFYTTHIHSHSEGHGGRIYQLSSTVCMHKMILIKDYGEY